MKIAIEIINQHLNSKYKCEDVFLDDNELVEKATGIRIKLTDNIFRDILKAKRREYLKSMCLI